MDALGLWDLLEPYNVGLKPRGTVFPYFGTILKEKGASVKVRFLLLEGWQTLHDFVRTRLDHDFGFYSSPIELPHLELVVLTSGEARLFRHDTGYMPAEAKGPQRTLGARLLPRLPWRQRLLGQGGAPCRRRWCRASRRAISARTSPPPRA